MAEADEIQRDLLMLEAELKKLEAEYNMFFAGRLPRPPWETRRRVEAIIRRWDRGHIQASAERFRFNTLQTRFATFADLWDRGLRAREEGRPGPFAAPPERPAAVPKSEAAPEAAKGEARVLSVTAFTDPTKETDKLRALYDTLMEARRQRGEEVVPFRRFAALVNDQVRKLREAGSRQVAFRVTVKDGHVGFTAHGVKQKK